MKTKPKATTPPKVTITRPEATVMVTINGTVHKLTEQEAKDLHASLGKALNVQPEVIFRDRVRTIPQWCQDPSPALPRLPPVYCQGGGFSR